jgi:hypothetical protein
MAWAKYWADVRAGLPNKAIFPRFGGVFGAGWRPTFAKCFSPLLGAFAQILGGFSEDRKQDRCIDKMLRKYILVSLLLIVKGKA